MIKNDVFVIGVGLGGERVGYDFQQKNYGSYLINGSGQDNKTLPDAKNVLVLEGYDGLAGDRNLAFKSLNNNKGILQKVKDTLIAGNPPSCPSWFFVKLTQT